jgi:hypothetical protein
MQEPITAWEAVEVEPLVVQYFENGVLRAVFRPLYERGARKLTEFERGMFSNPEMRGEPALVLDLEDRD